MIFVTVGTGEFDKLVKEIDNMVALGNIKEKVIVQTGRGNFKPRNCEAFDFAPSLDKYYEKADLVIINGGKGKVFEILNKNKKLIAVPNRDRTDPMHQVEFIKAIEKESKALLYCDNYKKIGEFIKKSKDYNFKDYKKADCKIDKVIIENV